MIHDSNLVFYADLRKHDGSTFMSDDAYGYPLTVTGATWGLQGRTFAGAEYIKYTVANWRSADETGTVIAWFKTSSATTQTLFASADGASAVRYLAFRVLNTGVLAIAQCSNDVTDSLSGAISVADGSFHMASFSSNGSRYQCTVDGILDTLTVTEGANTGDWFADTSDRDNITIGVFNRNTLISYMTGITGEVAIYNRALTPQEIQRIYLKTKSKYR